MHVYTEESNFENIANAIREKNGTDNTYTPSEMASAIEDIYSPKAEEVREVIIENNGLNTITPSEGFDVMKSVKINAMINAGLGFDLTSIGYSKETSDNFVKYYMDGIEYAKTIAKNWNPNITSVNWKYISNTNLIYFPDVDLTNIITAQGLFQSAYNLLVVPILNMPNATNISYILYNTNVQSVYLNAPKVVNLNYAFWGCENIKAVTLVDVSNVQSWTNAFNACPILKDLNIKQWKHGDIHTKEISILSSESIHDTIQNAVDLANGATERTFSLQSTAKTNWQNSEYYEQDLAILPIKGITIA